MHPQDTKCTPSQSKSQFLGQFLLRGLDFEVDLNGGYIWNKTEIKLKQNILFQFYFRRGYMWNKTETKHWNNSKTF